jgi:hypothetical protein
VWREQHGAEELGPRDSISRDYHCLRTPPRSRAPACLQQNSLLLVGERQAEDVAEGDEGALGGSDPAALMQVQPSAERAMTAAALAHTSREPYADIGCARIAAIEHSRRKLAGLRERAGQRVLQRSWAHDRNRKDIFEHLHDARVELGASWRSISPGQKGRRVRN